jgi:AcrR family transcriptional regulator
MSTTVRTAGVESVPDARERILGAGYELLSRQGIRAVAIDAIIERSGVARMTAVGSSSP